jgi:hypothetical protein
MAKNENTESFVRKKMSCEADKEKNEMCRRNGQHVFPSKVLDDMPMR